MLCITFLVLVTKMNRKKIKSSHTIPLIFLNLSLSVANITHTMQLLIVSSTLKTYGLT